MNIILLIAAILGAYATAIGLAWLKIHLSSRALYRYRKNERWKDDRQDHLD